MFEQINAQIPTRSHGEMSLIANSLKNMLKGRAQKHFGRQSLDFEEPGATRADITYLTRERCISQSKCGSKTNT